MIFYANLKYRARVIPMQLHTWMTLHTNFILNFLEIEILPLKPITMKKRILDSCNKMVSDLSQYFVKMNRMVPSFLARGLKSLAL